MQWIIFLVISTMPKMCLKRVRLLGAYFKFSPSRFFLSLRLAWLQRGQKEGIVLKEVVDGDDVGAKQSSVFAWQAVNLVNGSAVTRDGGPPALTALPAAAVAAGAYNSLLTKIIQQQLDFKDDLRADWFQRLFNSNLASEKILLQPVTSSN